jgi:hypothetical protein
VAGFRNSGRRVALKETPINAADSTLIDAPTFRIRPVRAALSAEG